MWKQSSKSGFVGVFLFWGCFGFGFLGFVFGERLWGFFDFFFCLFCYWCCCCLGFLGFCFVLLFRGFFNYFFSLKYSNLIFFLFPKGFVFLLRACTK